MPFQLKYRPRTFDDIIGHEAAVTRMKGIIKNLQKDPKNTKNAILITGASSAGKTTLARAFAAAINDVPDAEKSADYIEHNAGSEKTIEDVRNWIQTAKFRPQKNKRIICIDEAQQLLTNGQAAAALLKPLEEPSPNTIWILCSMDPTKFQTDKNGKAFVTRCTGFHLEPHSEKELLKFALRIAKSEKMSYALDDDREVLKAVVRNSQSAMRNVANLVEGLQEYYEGLDGKKPKMLDKEHVDKVLKSMETADDQIAAVVLHAVYTGQFKVVQKAMLDLTDAFMFINKLMWANAYMMNSLVLNGQRHRKVFPSAAARNLTGMCKDLKLTLGVFAAVNECLVMTKGQAQAFATTPEELLSAKLYRLIIDIHKGGK